MDILDIKEFYITAPASLRLVAVMSNLTKSSGSKPELLYF